MYLLQTNTVIFPLKKALVLLGPIKMVIYDIASSFICIYIPHVRSIFNDFRQNTSINHSNTLVNAKPITCGRKHYQEPILLKQRHGPQPQPHYGMATAINSSVIGIRVDSPQSNNLCVCMCAVYGERASKVV